MNLFLLCITTQNYDIAVSHVNFLKLYPKTVKINIQSIVVWTQKTEYQVQQV